MIIGVPQAVGGQQTGWLILQPSRAGFPGAAFTESESHTVTDSDQHSHADHDSWILAFPQSKILKQIVEIELNVECW